VAARLHISVKTAGNHVSSILAKLGLRSRVEAAAYAALHGAD
jgi:DNA-binding NarL/FixJ family response regulator